MNADRPTSLVDYVGQPAAVRELTTAITSAKRRGRQLDHVLISGGPGLGKTTLAHCLATALAARCTETSAPAIEHKGQLASLLVSLNEGDVLFVDEIHALKTAIAETLYTAMEDRVLDMPAGNKVIRVELPAFTLVGATTCPGKLPRPLVERFGHRIVLRPHSELDVAMIVARAAGRAGVVMDGESCAEVARRSRGVPRVALRLTRRVIDLVDGQVATFETVTTALDQLGIDRHGLEARDRAYMAIVCDRAIGLEAIAGRLGCDVEEVEGEIEPYLVRCGYVERTKAGRKVTEEGRAAMPLRLVA